MAPRDAAGAHSGGHSDADARRRAAIRRFALAHHPDRGGDPAVFDAGLRALRAGSVTDPAGAARPDVTAYRKRGPVTVLTAWLVHRWKQLARPHPPTRVR